MTVGSTSTIITAATTPSAATRRSAVSPTSRKITARRPRVLSQVCCCPPELPPRLAKVTTRPERLTAAAMPHGRGGPPSEREQLDPAAPGPGDEA